ncbi:HD-GYP domain-containing protein [Actinocrinis sp.]|uniref:HD-GYP domain-containing protein n=1 Tax=Actinocrinis sp. TaxID=1920516 RepID=UPI002D45C1AB|nr:HD domain-containing protein [Actinocrinis sp.]HZP54288.1 HD domain-containing protein [Actinocrinis sp.]
MTGTGAPARLYGSLTAPALLTCFALVIAGAAVLDVLLHGPRQPGIAAAFGVTIALGEAIRIALPHGRDSAPLSSTAALAFALCYSVNGARTTYGATEVIAVTAVAAVCGVSIQAYAGRHPRPGYLARRIIVTGFAAVLFRGWLMPGPASGLLARHSMPANGALLAGVAIAALILDNLLASLLTLLEPGRTPSVTAGPSRWDPVGLTARPSPSLRRLLSSFRDDCLATAWVCPTVILFAVAIALTARPLGLWVLPIAAAPILVVQRALRRYAEISATYQQTIRALSRVTELADYTEPGHARRVCHLALAIGRDLSLPDARLLDLEYAALLHDIGQLSLTDPIPGGATVLIGPERAASVAALGADVVRQTGVLDQVADILEHQWHPFCPEHADEPKTLAGAIIRAANAYDDLVGGALDPDRRLAALQRIRLGMATEYDPRVVESLTRIVESAEPYPG